MRARHFEHTSSIKCKDMIFKDKVLFSRTNLGGRLLEIVLPHVNFVFEFLVKDSHNS